jgi:hypothetical protein
MRGGSIDLVPLSFGQFLPKELVKWTWISLAQGAPLERLATNIAHLGDCLCSERVTTELVTWSRQLPRQEATQGGAF